MGELCGTEKNSVLGIFWCNYILTWFSYLKTWGVKSKPICFSNFNDWFIQGEQS